MSSPHFDAAHHFDDPHLPLRKASPHLLQSRRDGSRPLFAPQRGGFNPRPVQAVPKIDPRTASSDNAFFAAGREDRQPYKPPFAQGMQPRRELHSQQYMPNGRGRHSPSPYEMNGSLDIHKLRNSRSVGEGLRGGHASHTPPASTRLSFDSDPHGSLMYGEIRESLRSALTGQSSRVNSSSVNTDYSSAMTDNSSVSDFVYGTPKMRDVNDSGESFDVEDAIGLYEDGFESGRESFEIPRPKLSLDIRPSTASQQRLERPNVMHRRSQSASMLLGRTQASKRPEDVPPAVPQKESQLPPVPPMNVPRDRYGFKTISHHVSAAEYDAWNSGYSEHLERRRRKWIAMLRSYGLSVEHPIRFPPKSEKMKRYVRKGIPPEWRGAAWFWYAGGPYLLRKKPDLYRQLLQDVDEGKLSDNDREHIERDLNRTFPDNLKFKLNATSSTLDMPARAGGNGGSRVSSEPEVSIIRALRRVLQAFAVNNPSIGYCQSLNFIAGLLLLFLDEDEEKSFILLEQITSLHLPGTHGVTLEGANIDIAVLMSCIKDSLPQVWAKLDDKSEVPARQTPVGPSLRLPTVSLATTAWFMSLFVGTLPIESVLRVWDCLFFEGSKTLFRIALAIFKVGEKKIIATDDAMEIFQVVQTVPRSLLDINSLLEVCFKRRGGFGYLSQDVIERRREERRREVKAGLGADANGVFKKFRTRLRSKTAKD